MAEADQTHEGVLAYRGLLDPWVEAAGRGFARHVNRQILPKRGLRQEDTLGYQVLPTHRVAPAQPVALWQGSIQLLPPKRCRVASLFVAELHNNRDVNPTDPKLAQQGAQRVFSPYNPHVWIIRRIPPDQRPEKASCERARNSNLEIALLTTAGGAGACHSLIELVEDNPYPPEELLTCGRDPHAARVTLK